MPFIKSFEVSGYRGFNESVVLEPSNPQRSAPGSGLTILVGPNNGGKSSLVESMEIAARGNPVQLGRNLRHDGTEYRANFKLVWSDNTVTHMSSALNGQDVQVDRESTGKPEQRSVAYVPPFRDIPLAVGNPLTHEQFYRQQPYAYHRQYSPDRLNSRVPNWRQRANDFSTQLDRVLDFKFRLYQEGSTLHVKVHSHEHDPRGLGQGIVAVLNIIDAVWDAGEHVVLIEEPETSLHPFYQQRLLEVLMDFAQRVQIIYTTHSPYFVSWPSLANGASLYRVYRPPGSYCTLARLERPTIGGLIGLGGFQNPHVLGLNASEVFFLQDRIILTEGQDDVVYYREMATQRSAQLSGQFYGWGAGGADNFPRILRLFDDLGFRKVVTIVDRNKGSMVGELRAAFPDYRFVTIPTDDVRDKDKEGRTIEGLCSRNGKIHPHHTQHVDELFAAIGDALK